MMIDDLVIQHTGLCSINKCNDRTILSIISGLLIFTGEIKKIAIGRDHCIGLTTDGILFSWGNNDHGQCNVPSTDSFLDIAVGNNVSYGIKADGSLCTWGEDVNFQLNMPKGNDFLAVAASEFYAFALKTDGTLVSWGNDLPQLPKDAGYISIAAGNLHNLALKSDGNIIAWGYSNEFGQENCPNSKDFISIAAGSNHSLALKNDGSIIGWGLNDKGQCDVPTNEGFIAIAAGGSHSIALRYDGKILVWGDNSKNQSDSLNGGKNLDSTYYVFGVFAGFNLSIVVNRPRRYYEHDSGCSEEDYYDFVPLCDAFDREDLCDYELQEAWDHDYKLYHKSNEFIEDEDESNINDNDNDAYEDIGNPSTNKSCNESDVINTSVSVIANIVRVTGKKPARINVPFADFYKIHESLIFCKQQLEGYGISVGIANSGSLFILGSENLITEDLDMIAQVLPENIIIARSHQGLVFISSTEMQEERLIKDSEDLKIAIQKVKDNPKS
jgi:hypothetical protein